MKNKSVECEQRLERRVCSRVCVWRTAVITTIAIELSLWLNWYRSGITKRCQGPWLDPWAGQLKHCYIYYKYFIFNFLFQQFHYTGTYAFLLIYYMPCNNYCIEYFYQYQFYQFCIEYFYQYKKMINSQV